MASTLIYVLTTPIQHGNLHFFNAMMKDNTLLEGRVIPSKDDQGHNMAKKLQRGAFVLVQKYSLTSTAETQYLKLNVTTSKVFQTGSTFPLDETKVEEFYHAPICTVPEATVSPKKRRLSIRGTISQIYDKKQTATWCRKDVYIEDIPTAKKICVKLWDHHADKIDKGQEGQIVMIENVEVDIYQDRRQLKSTDLTNITIGDQQSEQNNTHEGEYEVIGVDEEEDGCILALADDTQLKLDNSILQQQEVTLEEFTFMTPIKVNLTINNDKIERIVIPRIV